LQNHIFNPARLPEPSKQVVFTSGSWYEMGRQYGKQAEHGVKVKTAAGMAAVITKYKTKSHALECLDVYLELLKRKAPSVFELWNGIADGAGLSREDIYLAYMNFSRLDERCSNISAWGQATASGGMICGMNCDEHETVNYFAPVVAAWPEDGYAFISASAFTCNCVMNEKGLVLMASCGVDAREEDLAAVGLPNCLSLMLCAADCETTEEARDKIIREGLGPGSGENIHIADAKGHAVVIEHTASYDAVRHSGDHGEKDYLLATNFFLSPQMKAANLKGDAAKKRDSSQPRYWSEEQMLLSAWGKLDLDAVNKALGCSDFYIDTARMESHMWEPSTREFTSGWNREIWKNSQGSEYQLGAWSPEIHVPFAKCVFSALMDPVNKDFYITNGCRDTLMSVNPNTTGNFMCLHLCNSVVDTVKRASEDAQIQIFLGARDMARSNKKDGERLKHLNGAKAAFLEGVNLMNLAVCEENRLEQLDLFGKSATAFCRAQCYGQLALDESGRIFGNGDCYKKKKTF